MVKKFFSLLLVTLMILSIGITKANRVYADNSEIFDGVWQGEDGTNFAKDANATNIFIIESKVQGYDNANNAKAVLNDEAKADGFFIGPGYKSRNEDGKPDSTDNTQFLKMLIIDTYDEENEKSILEGTENTFEYDDPIVTYTFKEAAQLGDGSLGDVVVAYEKVKLITPNEDHNKNYGDVSLGTGNGFHGHVNGRDGEEGGQHRMGVMIDINVYVEKDGEKVKGSFYFPVKGITINRAGGYSTDFEDYENEHYFSEGMVVDSGYLLNNDEISFFVPGGTTTNDRDATVGYTPGVGSYNGNTYFYGNQSPHDGDNSYYTGFLTVADNTNGITATYIMGISRNPSASTGKIIDGKNQGVDYDINNNILAGHTKDGTSLIHQIKATTGVGGDCETTVAGNPKNDLSDGSTILKSNKDALQAVPTGKTMTYKMTPKPGYKLKKVTVNNGSIDYTGGQEVEPTPVKAEDGTILYYTYTFENINEDKSLHVEWEPCDYHIDYDANGGEGTMDPQDFTGADETMKSKDNAFTREGYHFTGFKALDKDGNPVKDKDGKELPLFETAEDFKAYLIALGDGAKITLQAQWEPDEYTIKYDPNGGEGTMTEQHFSGTDKEAKSKPNEFTAGGFDFVGFKAKDKDGNYLKDKDGNDLVFANPADFISYLKKQGNGGEITLVAQWRKKEYKSPIPKTGIE